MVVFHCFRDQKCEWQKGLESFTAQFNKEFGTTYTLSKCLDVFNRTEKEPEVLLEGDANQLMVIECKKIIYPPDYYKNHRHWHRFFDGFNSVYKSKLMPLISEDAYIIHINEYALYKTSMKDKELNLIIQQIIDYIVKNLSTFLELDEISSENPIPWCFHRAFDSDKDSPEETGLRLRGVSSSPRHPRKNDIEELTRQINKNLDNADKKLKKYTSCLKILIFEKCGSFNDFLILEQIDEIIPTLGIPSSIDQIWVANPQGENDIKYSQVFVKNSID